MEWTANVVKMDQGRTVKRVVESLPGRGGSRIRGRPRLRWLEDRVKVLQDMKVK